MKNLKKITLSTNEKVGFISNLSTMLAAGISIIEIIDSLMEDSKGNTRILLQSVKDDINQGNRIYAAFEKFPLVFDKVTVNIIKASEEAGTLDKTLIDLKDTIKKEQEFLDKVRSAFIYPSLILVMFMGVLILVLTFVIPRIAVVFSRLKSELPLPTKILIFFSDLLLKQTVPLLIGLVVVVGGFILLFRANRKGFLNVVFSLPLVSNLMRYIDLTRFTRSLHLLLSAGIPIVTALDLTKDIVNKKSVRTMIEKCGEMVLAGKPFSEGLRTQKRVVPRIMLKIVEAGEKSGGLDKALLDISQHLDYEVTTTLATITTLLEPLLLMVVGVMVGGMMLSIIAPIYGLIGSVGGG